MPDFPPSSTRLDALTGFGDKVTLPGVNESTSGAVLTLAVRAGFGKAMTHVSPGTVYSSVFDETGTGYILGLVVVKGGTVNGVSVTGKLTIDGVLIYEGAVTASSTASENGPLVGTYSDNAAVVIHFPAFIPFHRDAKFEVKFSADPGAGENITTHHLVAVTA